MRTTTKRALWITATTMAIALPTAAAWAATDDPTEGQVTSMMDSGSRGSMMGSGRMDSDDTDLACNEHADSGEMKGWRSDAGETMRSYHKRVTAGGAANHMTGAGHMGRSGMWDGASD